MNLHGYWQSTLRLAIVVLALMSPPRPAHADAPPEQVASQIRQRVEQMRMGGGLIQPATRTHLGEALAAFYEQRHYEPAWSKRGRVDALVEQLQQLELDGLNPNDYRLAQIESGRASMAAASPLPAQQADFDLLATQGYLLALAHLYRGKLDPHSLDPTWNVDPRQFDPQKGLQVALDAVEGNDIASAFAQARPQHPVYRLLRKALMSLREVEARGGWERLPDGPTLKPGMSDPRVPLLRRRLAVSNYLPMDAVGSSDYDAALESAVRDFQAEQYLTIDGGVGRGTREALNVPVHARIDQLRVNLERARWLLHEVHDRVIVVDIAGYRLLYFEGTDPTPAWTTRVQVGRSIRRTPLFRSMVEQVTFNPTWVVPPTILREDILPKLSSHPDYLEKNKLHVFDAQWKELPAQGIDWSQPPAGLRLRQDAGPEGALGHIKISFPNPYDVYLHETPHKELFGRGQRAFSSGCIRVEDPFHLAELVFDDPANWNRAAIDAAIATGETRTVRVAKPIPILLAYWTVDLHDGRRTAFKPDIYRLDWRTLKALNAKP